MKKWYFLCVLLLGVLQTQANNNAVPREFYLIKIFHCSSQKQLDHIDQYLQSAYLPFLHKSGFKKIGVFSPLDNDTSADKRIYVWIPLKTLNQLEQLDQPIENLDPFGNDPLLRLDNKDSSLPYNRIEVLLTKAFKLQPQFNGSSNLIKTNTRIYEYRSYESPTEEMHLRKIHMFNEGQEITLFNKLNFNAIFYSKVIAGGRTPNLIYMTSFNNMAERDAHWKAFFDDAIWKKIAPDKKYQKIVNKGETVLMTAKNYADF